MEQINGHCQRTCSEEDNEKITLNVSGHVVVTTKQTLLKYPQTKLGRLATNHQPQAVHYLDADVAVFREVMEYYRTGELHTPPNVCNSVLSRELRSWEISCDVISDCCQDNGISETELECQFAWFEKRIEPAGQTLSYRDNIWYFLTDPIGPHTKFRMASKLWMIFYIGLVLVKCGLTSVLTLPRDAFNMSQVTFQTQLEYIYRGNESCEAMVESIGHLKKIPGLVGLDMGIVVIFGIEIIVRLLCCPRKAQFFKSFNIIDLVTTSLEVVCYFLFYMPSYASPSDLGCRIASAIQACLYAVVQLRIYRVFKLALIYSELRVLLLVIYQSRKEIILLSVMLIISCLIFAPAVYLSELLGGMYYERQTSIANIPTTYWWVIVTMSTVGYGDYYPTTLPGYLSASVVMMIGMIVTALPIAIIGENFTVYYKYNRKRVRRANRPKL